MKFMKSLLTKEDERALREMATECGYADVMNAFGVDEFYRGYIKGLLTCGVSIIAGATVVRIGQIMQFKKRNKF